MLLKFTYFENLLMSHVTLHIVVAVAQTRYVSVNLKVKEYDKE